MTPDTVAAVLTVVSGGLALWGLNQHLGRRVERHARIAAEAALRKTRAELHRERLRLAPWREPSRPTAPAADAQVSPMGGVAPLRLPLVVGTLVWPDPPADPVLGLPALCAAEPEDATEEQVLGGQWIDIPPEAFEPVRALPTPTLINPVRSN